MVSLNWPACSRWTCFPRPSTLSAWRICALEKSLPSRPTWIQLNEPDDDGRANGSTQKFCAAGFAVVAGGDGTGGLFDHPQLRGIALQSHRGGSDIRLDLATRGVPARFLRGHLPIPLAAGRADSTGAEFVFCRLCRGNAGIAGAVGGVVAP